MLVIAITHKTLEAIPLLEFVQESKKDKRLPLVIFYHGWTSVKEQVLVQGYEMAQRGFRVLLPEALYHGERADDQPFEAHYPDFWKIVVQNIQEFGQLTDCYVEAGLADAQRLGVAGLSMGGITTCGILASYPNVAAAVCLMGAPKMRKFAEGIVSVAANYGVALPANVNEQLEQLNALDLAQHPERIAGRPVHFWHGRQDPTVPFILTETFIQEIAQADYAQNVSFHPTEDKHKVPYPIAVETAEFFAKNL